MMSLSYVMLVNFEIINIVSQDMIGFGELLIILVAFTQRIFFVLEIYYFSILFDRIFKTMLYEIDQLWMGIIHDYVLRTARPASTLLQIIKW